MIGSIKRFYYNAKILGKYRNTVNYHVGLYKDGTIDQQDLIELLAKGALLLTQEPENLELMEKLFPKNLEVN